MAWGANPLPSAKVLMPWTLPILKHATTKSGGVELVHPLAYRSDSVQGTKNWKINQSGLWTRLESDGSMKVLGDRHLNLPPIDANSNLIGAKPLVRVRFPLPILDGDSLTAEQRSKKCVQLCRCAPIWQRGLVESQVMCGFESHHRHQNISGGSLIGRLS